MTTKKIILATPFQNELQRGGNERKHPALNQAEQEPHKQD